MTYNTSVADTLDDRMLDDGSIIGGRSVDSASDKPGLPQASTKLKASRQARPGADHDGIKGFMLDFTVSAAKTDTSESHMRIAPATGDFLKVASFLVQK
jgi:hypothetical protein